LGSGIHHPIHVLEMFYKSRNFYEIFSQGNGGQKKKLLASASKSPINRRIFLHESVIKFFAIKVISGMSLQITMLRTNDLLNRTNTKVL